VAQVKAVLPDIPLIGFPREAGQANYAAYAKESGVDAVGLDQDMNLEWARDTLQPLKIVQGNLDPELLLRGGDAMLDAAEKICATLGAKPFIFNLGHGVIKETPPEHVGELIEFVRNFKL
jgi:uroporphyrinogen decarboxylase